MHLNWNFLIVVEAKVNIITRYVLPYGTMVINEYQRSRLTFHLRSLILNFHQCIKTVFSETIRLIKFKFHMKTPFVKLAKIFTNCSGHMPKMADMPIYGKNPLKIFSRIIFFLFDLILYVHSTIFQLCGTVLPGLNQY